METVRVVEVTDGNTLATSRPWQFGSNQGNLIRIKGLAASPLDVPQGQMAKCKLTLLLLGSCVDIEPTNIIDGQALVCEVHFQGRSIPSHLPEYAERARECQTAGTE